MARMSHPRVRPTFTRELSGDPREFFAALADAIARTDGPCCGQMLDDGAMLRIRRDERRVWSPALYLRVVPAGDGGRALYGRFSPSSPVWTAFVGIYIALAFLAIAATSYGFAQMTLDETPWAFLGVPVTLLIAGLNAGVALLTMSWLVSESTVRRRAACGLAALSVSTVLFLGAAWPSPFTLVALGVLPAALAGLWGLIDPRITRKRWFRVYTVSAILLAAASYAMLAAFWFLSGVQGRMVKK